MIGDTTFFIDLMRSDPRAVEAALRCESRGNPVSLTSVTVFELRIGLSTGLRGDKKVAEMYSVLDGLRVLSLDQQAAVEAGKIFAEKEKSGRGIDMEDALLAGIALVKKEEILTRHTTVFSGIDGVEVIPY